MAGTHFLPRLNPWVSMRVNFYDFLDNSARVGAQANYEKWILQTGSE